MGAAEVSGVVVAKRTDDGDVFGECSQMPEMFANLQAGSGGGDGIEFTANFGGGVGFEIEGVKLAGATPHEQQQTAACLAKTGCVGDAGEWTSRSARTRSEQAECSSPENRATGMTGSEAG